MSQLINEWMGNAPTEPARVTVDIVQALEGLLYEVRFPNERTARYRAQDGDGRSNIASALAQQIQSWAAWSVTQADALLSLEATQSGVPIARGVGVHTPPSSFVERVQSGRRPVPQVIEVTLPATTTGGTWDLTIDFGSGEETADDLAHDITPAALVTAIEALATPEGGDVSVVLVSSSPRTYRITLGGSLATGINATVSADATSLTGNASATVQRVQAIGGNAQAVWMLRIAYRDGQHEAVVTIGEESYPVDVIINQNIQTESWWNSRLPADVTGFKAFDYNDAVDPENRFALIAFAVPDSVAIDISSSGTDQAVQQATATQLQDHLGETNDEFQWLSEPGLFAASRTLTFDGQTTASHDSNFNAQSELEALTNISAGDVELHLGIGAFFETTGQQFVSDAPALVRFKNGLGSADQPQITASDVIDTGTLIDGSGPVNDIHAVTLFAEGGTWTGRVPIGEPLYDPTAGIDYAETAANVKTAIGATLDEGETVDVAGGGVPGNPYLIEYTGDLAETTIPLIEIDTSSLTGGKPIETETVGNAVEGQNEIQRLRVDPRATGGTLRLGFRGAWTGSTAYDSGADDWETSLQAVTTIGNDNALTAGSAAGLLVEFVADLGWEPLDLLTVDQDGLETEGPSAIARRIGEMGSGPNTYNVAANWSLGHVPNTGESIVFGSGRQHCWYGLVQRGTWEIVLGGASSTQKMRTSDVDLVDNQIVRLRTSDAFPTAEDDDEQAITIDAETDYYIVGIDRVNNTILLATEEDGSPINWTSAGSGTHWIEVQAAELIAHSRFSGNVGLGRRRNDGTFEWLPRYLEIGLLAADDHNLLIGIGDGSGSNRLHCDLSGSPVTGMILSSGAGSDAPAVQLLLDHAAATLEIINGEVAIASELTESSTMKRLINYGGRALLGQVTLAERRDYVHGIEYVRGSAAADQIVTAAT
jgi:hypothetical protein